MVTWTDEGEARGASRCKGEEEGGGQEFVIRERKGRHTISARILVAQILRLLAPVSTNDGRNLADALLAFAAELICTQAFVLCTPWFALKPRLR